MDLSGVFKQDRIDDAVMKTSDETTKEDQTRREGNDSDSETVLFSVKDNEANGRDSQYELFIMKRINAFIKLAEDNLDRYLFLRIIVSCFTLINPLIVALVLTIIMGILMGIVATSEDYHSSRLCLENVSYLALLTLTALISAVPLGLFWRLCMVGLTAITTIYRHISVIIEIYLIVIITKFFDTVMPNDQIHKVAEDIVRDSKKKENKESEHNPMEDPD